MAGKRHRSEYGAYMRRKARCIKLFSVLAVLVMTMSVLCTVTVDDTEVDAGSTKKGTILWMCILTTGSSGSVDVTYCTRASTSDNWSSIYTTPVSGSGAKEGTAWFFNPLTGFGPFNLFYAAFDPSTGNMVCHLSPYALSRSMNASDKSNYADGSYNIMWVLPMFYATTSGNNLVFTNDSTVTSDVYNAFICNGTTYNYIAYGVYEGTGSDKLGSAPGKTPTACMTLEGFREMANNNPTTGDVKVAQVMNFYQWQAYRFCAMATMGTVNSQSQVGYGNIRHEDGVMPTPSETGTLNSYGPYTGTRGDTTISAKLFIENMWGSLWEFLDDTQLDSNIRAGTNSYEDIGKYYNGSSTNPTVWTFSRTDKAYIWPHGTGMSQTLSSWGLPTGSSSSTSTSDDALDVIIPATINRGELKYTPGNVVYVGGSANDGLDAGLSAITAPEGNQSSAGGTSVGARVVFMFNTDTKIIHTLTPARDQGSTSSVTIDGTTNYTYNTFSIYNGGKVTIDNNKNSATYGNKLSYTNIDGQSVVITITANDGYRLLGWFKDSDNVRTEDGIIMDDDHTLTMYSQSIAVVTVGTDGGGTLQEIRGNTKTSLSGSQTYMVAKSKSAISVCGNTMTFSGSTFTKTAVATPSTITITATAKTVADGDGKDYRIRGWNEDGGSSIVGATRDTDGSLKPYAIDLSKVSAKTLTLDTWETATMSIPAISGATLTLKSGSSETDISAGQIFTLDLISESSDAKGAKYPTVTIMGNVIAFAGYIGSPGDDIVEMSAMTVTAKAVQNGKDNDYRLAGWYFDGKRYEGTSSQPKMVSISGDSGSVERDGSTTSNATAVKMDVKRTKTFYIDAKYGGSLSAGITLNGSGPYLFTLDIGSSVTVGNGSNGYGQKEIGFKGYYGAIPSTQVTGTELDDQKLTANPNGDYRFWIWSSKHADDDTATSDSSQSYVHGAKLYARFVALVSSSSVLQSAIDNSVGLIEVNVDVSIDRLTLTKDADNLGGPYVLLKPGTTTTAVSSLTVGDDTAITIQSDGAAPMTLSASAEEEAEARVAKLVSTGKMSVFGKLTNNGMLSNKGEGMFIETNGMATNNNVMDFYAGATYAINGGELANNGLVRYVVTAYDQLLDALSKPISPITIVVEGDGVVVTDVIDIPGSGSTVSLYVEKDSTLSIATGGGINIKDNCTLTVDGTLANNGDVTIQGTVDPSGEESANKSGYVKVNNSIDSIAGTFAVMQYGTLEIASDGTVRIEKGSSFDNVAGTIVNDGMLIFDVHTQNRLLEFLEKAYGNTRIDAVENIDITSAITIPSPTNADGAPVELVFTSGTESTIASNGSITVTDNGKVTVAGKLTNEGSISATASSDGGLLKISAEGILNNIRGKLIAENNGKITVAGYQDNTRGTLKINNGAVLTIEASGTVHVDLDSTYDKASNAALNNRGLLIIDVSDEERLNEALEYAEGVNNQGSGEFRIEIVTDMKIKGKIKVPEGANLVITEDTTTIVRPYGKITVLDGGTLTVNGTLKFEYGGNYKIEDGGNLIVGDKGRIIMIKQDGEEEEWVPKGSTSKDDMSVTVVACAAATIASLFAMTMFVDQYNDSALVTFYSSKGGKASKKSMRVPNGTEMMIKGRNAIFYIEGKELPQIITAEPEKGHRFNVWNIYDQDDGSWYPSKGHSIYGDEKSFFIVGNVEVDAMFLEGENDGLRGISYDCRVRVVKGPRDPNALSEQHEDRIGIDEW